MPRPGYSSWTYEITQPGSVEQLPGPIQNITEFDFATPMAVHRFESNEDIKRLFQQQLRRFPQFRINGTEQRMFSEFGAIMLRPRGEVQNRLTHVVFPETTLSIPRAGRSLRSHSDISFPQARLMADAFGDALYTKVMADNPTEDHFTERVSLVLSLQDVFFNSDLWDYVNKADQQTLSRYGFGPGMNFERWAQAIRNCPNAFLEQYEINGEIVTVKELPMAINQRGNVGSRHSYHQMPGFVIWAVLENTFSEEQDFYEIGSAHIHPEIEFQGISEVIANRLGPRVAQMTLSPADVKVLRGSIDGHNNLLRKHRLGPKDTGETFVTIVGVDAEGNPTDVRHHDLGLIDNLDEMRDLNDRTLQTWPTDNPDIGLIEEHYRFFSDPSISADEFGADIGEHVGSVIQGAVS